MFFKCFTLHVMNLKYMKVSLFEISYKKKFTFSRRSNLFEMHLYINIMLLRSYSALNKKKTFSHQAGFISPSEGRFGVKTIMPAILKGSFQTEVLKTGHFKGPFGMKDFEGYN